MSPREFATDVIRNLHEAGYEALFAGGCVRDQLLGLEPADYDIATAATPDVVQKLFRRTVAVGVSFGVVDVLGPKPLKVQVATFRSDGSYSDNRRPDAVSFGSAREDALRRDFTINGLFFNPLTDELIDYVGGEADLQRRTLRAIGDPAARFAEDHLRLLRAVRIAARFQLTIEPATLAAIQQMAPRVTSVSGERIADELRKLLSDPNRRQGVASLHDSGLLRAILPECSVPNLDAMARLGRECSFELSFAFLLNDVPLVALGPLCERLRLSNLERERIRWLVRHAHDLANAEAVPLHVVKPLLSHRGAAELLDLHRALGHDSAVAWCRDKLNSWPADRLNPPMLLTGDDLTAFGLTPGPLFKRILDAVRNAQLDEKIHSHAEARDVALDFVSRGA